MASFSPVTAARRGDTMSRQYAYKDDGQSNEANDFQVGPTNAIDGGNHDLEGD
jgi:hypothetical protein